MTLCAVGVQPAQWEESFLGATIDWGSGNAGYAIQMVGGVVSGSSIAGKIEHSADGLVWFDLPGAAFATVVNSDRSERIAIATMLRYVRWNATVSAPGGGYLFASGLFIQP